ncbi:hypothetical protein LXT21_35980 [Myxococcus sp. K38C18041901]|uniref:hypothetical protein n=1 Tax=Myxococcus guangdongensis TaxID=2906760 RepID=UPI0020A766ED|nr:hypothetical protein [Myxococcus guangdongensis]MCP3064186.1 hypothetical protein [Myxococcus guangdongensis]
MTKRWMSAVVFTVALVLGACGGLEEGEAPEQVPAADMQESQPGDTHQQAIPCDAQGRCPANLSCTIGWTCRYAGGHV